MFRRNTFAFILHGQSHKGIGDRRIADLHGIFRRAIFQRVSDQVADQLGNLHAIASNAHLIFMGLDGDPVGCDALCRTDRLAGLFNQRSKRNLLGGRAIFFCGRPGVKSSCARSLCWF